VRRLLAAAGLLTLAGCADTTDAAAIDGSAATTTAAPDPRAAVEALQERIDDDFAAVYQQAIDAQVADAIRNLLLVAEPPARIRRQRFLFALYQSREFAPAFVQNSELRSTARPVLQTLGNAGAHGLDASRFVDSELRGALDAVADYGGLLANVPALELTRDERRTILDLLEQIPADQLADPQAWLMGQLLDPATSPLPELARHHATVVRAGRLAAGAMAMADVLLVDRTLDYAFEQRHFNTSTVDEEITEAQRDAMIAERMTGTFQVLVDADTDEQVQAMLDALPPTLPQYPRLMETAARYRQIVAAGGWIEVDPGNVRRGSRGARVQALKERLAAEGYYTGAIDDVFDTPLTDAIQSYEETHQLEVDGEVDRTFVN
jgi:murein L,D-transpeptidase YcbB/YkuD